MSSLLVMVPECGHSPRTTRTRLDLPQPLLPMMRRLLRARTVTLSPVSRSRSQPGGRKLTFSSSNNILFSILLGLGFSKS